VRYPDALAVGRAIPIQKVEGVAEGRLRLLLVDLEREISTVEEIQGAARRRSVDLGRAVAFLLTFHRSHVGRGGFGILRRQCGTQEKLQHA